MAQLPLDTDPETVTQDIWKSINQLYGKISHLVNYKYHLLIYRLMKNPNIPKKELEEATGNSRQRLYEITNEFEQREIERQHESETNNR